MKVGGWAVPVGQTQKEEEKTLSGSTDHTANISHSSSCRGAPLEMLDGSFTRRQKQPQQCETTSKNCSETRTEVKRNWLITSQNRCC